MLAQEEIFLPAERQAPSAYPSSLESVHRTGNGLLTGISTDTGLHVFIVAQHFWLPQELWVYAVVAIIHHATFDHGYLSAGAVGSSLRAK